MASFGTAMADDNEDWPAPVYFPQRAEQPTTTTASPSRTSSTAPSGKSASGAPLNEGKHHFLHFRRKEPKAKAPFNVVPPKPSADKADPPASPFPLLRLPMPIITDQGIVPPGIYLLKTEVSNPSIGSQTSVQKAPKAIINGEKPLLLTRQNEVMAKIPIHPAAMPDEDTEETGTSSPITPADPRIAAPISAKIELSPDQKTLHLVVTSGKQAYESDEYAVGTDLRHKLTF